MTWAAEIIKDEFSELISWRSIGDADVVSAGSVRFKPVNCGRSIDVRVKLQYDPPAGKVGATIAWLFGQDPQTQIEEDLQRFKEIIGGGEGSDRYKASWDVAAPSPAAH